MSAGAETHFVEGSEGALAALLAAQATPVQQGQLHVVEHREVVYQVVTLENEANFEVAQPGQFLPMR